MTLIEAREALEPRIHSNKRPPLLQQQDLDSSSPTGNGFVDESGSEDEFLIANDHDDYIPNGVGGGDDDNEENNNYRDFFSLPTLGLNYLNNLNLSLNLNINLRNSPLWRIYENTSFTKPGFLLNYLGKHSDDVDVDGMNSLNEHDINPDSRGYFLTNFLRRHGFPSYDEDCFSEEAILERVRFKKLQQQASAAARTRKLVASPVRLDDNLEKSPSKAISKSHSIFSESENSNSRVYGSVERVEVTLEEQIEKEETVEAARVLQDKKSCDYLRLTESSEVKSELQCGDDTTYIDDKQEMGYGSSSPQILNPFYNRVELSWWDKIKIGFLCCTILPIKGVLMVVVLILALLLCCVGMFGVTFEESQNYPLRRWRRCIRWILAHIVMRAFIFCSGFVWSIKETGKRATPEEAPIFVVGPHSSYFDAFAVILLGAPSVVAKLSTKDIPVFGRLVTFTQAVYVSRESKGSRKQTMEVLKQRAQDVYHGNGMPQIFIFPEGTCSNRSSLIKFKPGAFVPQVPVQPVLIRYPNQFDSCTWTFDGPPAGRNICYALAQFFNKIEIEYLPVYEPNEAEKQDSALFADNVRKVMAKALNVPLSDYQFEDGMLLCTMREKLGGKLRSIHRAKKALGLSGSTKECTSIFDLEATSLLCFGTNASYNMGFYDFQRKFFHVSSEDTTVPEVQVAFNCFKKETDQEEKVDIRPYLVLTCILYEEKNMLSIQDIPRKVCQMYGLKDSEITTVEMKRLLEELFELSPDAEGGKSTSSASMNVQLTNETDQRISRILDFAKLFADEITERLPKTYPSREERDKKSMPSSSSLEKLKYE